MDPRADYDCQACGACCCNSSENAAEGTRWWVEIGERERILSHRKVAQRHVHRDDDGVAHLRMDDRGRCTALRGALGQRVSCAIYEVRPRACRRVEPGSQDCERARRERLIG